MILALALGAAAGLTCIGMAVWGKYGAWVWYDNLAHGLGGLCLAAFATLALGPLPTAAAVTGIALAWELFEWWRDIHPWGGSATRDAAWEDTALDMVMVWGGTALAVVLLTPWP